jgi:hypothetical protein
LARLELQLGGLDVYEVWRSGIGFKEKANRVDVGI